MADKLDREFEEQEFIEGADEGPDADLEEHDEEEEGFGDDSGDDIPVNGLKPFVEGADEGPEEDLSKKE